jgi:hypothetical protein
MNHKQLVSQLEQLKAEMDSYRSEVSSLRGQLSSYENVETEIKQAPTSRRNLLKRLGLGAAGLTAAAIGAGFNGAITQAVSPAEVLADNAVEATSGTSGYAFKGSSNYAQMQLVPNTIVGVPSGSHNAGELVVNSTGDFYVSTSNAATGWRKVASANSYGDANGHTHPGMQFLLISPDRFEDTRNASFNRFQSPYGGNAVPVDVSATTPASNHYTATITGVPGAKSSYQIPAGAKGVFGNLTVLNPAVNGATAVAGSVKVAAGTVIDPNVGTATLAYNFTAPGQNLSNSFTSALSATGSISVLVAFPAGGNHKLDIIIDVVGYFF